MASQTCPAFIRITFMTDRPVALVTGAARRLGREISLALASQGWAVAVHYATSGTQAVTTASDCLSLIHI